MVEESCPICTAVSIIRYKRIAAPSTEYTISCLALSIVDLFRSRTSKGSSNISPTYHTNSRRIAAQATPVITPTVTLVAYTGPAINGSPNPIAVSIRTVMAAVNGIAQYYF